MPFSGIFAFGDHFRPCPACAAMRSLHRPHLLELLELLAEVVEGEVALLKLLLLLLDLFLAQLRLDPADLFDQAHEVALAQDALGHALRMEFLEPVELLADADELDRRPW